VAGFQVCGYVEIELLLENSHALPILKLMQLDRRAELI
jgi:hypothetical protein